MLKYRKMKIVELLIKKGRSIMSEDTSFEVIRDLGSFGDSKWKKHLTLTRWFGREEVFDIRGWNEDLTKCNKGITLTRNELLELKDMLNNLFEEDDQ